MSGDVQPRKRKDKKRKKDDNTEQIPIQPQVTSTGIHNEELNIHVHKEDGTGGGICAKIIFFLLFSALTVLIGLIMIEHRGLTDLDTVDTESRFSLLFEGWVDNSVGHDEHEEVDHKDSLEATTHDYGEHVEESHEFEEHQAELEDDEELQQEEEEEEEEDVDQDEEDEGRTESEEEDEVEPTEEDDEEDDDENEDTDLVSDEVPQTEEEEDGNDDEEDDENESELQDNIEDENEDEDDEQKEEDEEEVENVSEDDELTKEQSAEERYDNNADDNDDDDDDDDKTEDDQTDDSHEQVVVKSKEKTSEEIKDEEEQKEEAESEIGDEDKDQEEQNSKSVNVSGNEEPEESDGDKQSDADTYEYETITNVDDLKIKEQIDEAHKNIQNSTAYAIKLFDALLKKHPLSPRTLYGKGQALEKLADKKRSNEILQKAISIYLNILEIENVPDALFKAVAERSIDRLRFLGNYNRAIDVHYKLMFRFPEEPKYKNQLVVSLLTINRVNNARLVLQDILSLYPNDGFALVHYGFILKTVDNNLNKSVEYLQRGISTKAPGVIDGRFYFHLGDALTRLGRTKEAMEVYEEGVKHKLFLSKYQRSLYNVQRLKGRPWWKKEETPYANLYAALESHWKEIRTEGISVLNKNGLFQNESENLKNTGDWKQFELFARGQKNVNNCKKCPVTCKIIESIADARGCRRGQTKFSVMHPGTHVWPHCGPTNCRLRVHLGLKVPPHTYIRVADETRTWREGEIFIFDDSFEHEVWHNGTSFRLILIIDVWHPELTPTEKRTLSTI